ncbi:MAG TPA: flagellar basal-body MS-ring/collar protein FliF [Rudaea sp.]|jgi:flagellar M-ring protein FliF|nr:flagellar basal-body MS-ring/collar protein FliF [Rudaea sp.]
MAALANIQRWQDIPGIRQGGMLLALAGAIAIGLAVFFWSQKPAMSPLFSGLADKDAAEVVEALRASNIEYQIDPGTGAINVPEGRVREARMNLAQKGLPGGTQGGIEMIEKDQGFGTSQFVEGARYQHALETEIARTIGDLKPVKEARVHLALPKPSPFSKTHDAASASVMLQLYPGREIEQNQIGAIVHLVASSIPDLSPQRVTVVDQNGRLLTQADPDSEEARSAQQFEQRRRMETTLVSRIRDLLEPMTGPGRVSAQVAVDMDFSETEEAKESYAPDQGKIRNEQTSEQTAAVQNSASGVPGATSNTPPSATPAPAAATAASSPTSSSKTASRSFDYDRTLSHTRQPGGRIRRITAAVLVDNIPASTSASGDKDTKKETTAVAGKPLDENQLKQVDALVRQAIGFDDKRGDSVSVMNASFVRNETPVEDPGVPFWKQPMMHDISRLAIGSLIVLVLIFGVLRPTLRNLTATRLIPLGPNDIQQLPGSVLSDEPRIPNGGTGYEDKLRVAKSTANQDPKKVAQIVKNWVSDDA